LGALLSGAAECPPQGARYDVAFEGPVVAQRLMFGEWREPKPYIRIVPPPDASR
jgi:hypothetical protein